ncbi:unnamed protein product [Amoebophrya sp. A120]|nr:unnamed protein product [Amoebophrya sp. A120]|eukprot:GSA120T00007489001.1
MRKYRQHGNCPAWLTPLRKFFLICLVFEKMSATNPTRKYRAMLANAITGSGSFWVEVSRDKAEGSGLYLSNELGGIRSFLCLVCLLRWDSFLTDMVAEVSTRIRKSKLEYGTKRVLQVFLQSAHFRNSRMTNRGNTSLIPLPVSINNGFSDL